VKPLQPLKGLVQLPKPQLLPLKVKPPLPLKVQVQPPKPQPPLVKPPLPLKGLVQQLAMKIRNKPPLQSITACVIS
jgi:hypothetical protein